MKHTKGPWKLNKVDHLLLVEDQYSIVATIEPQLLDNDTDNARLIATAPEMLEALELSLTYLKVANNDNGLICDVAIETIQAVIKKAKGE